MSVLRRLIKKLFPSRREIPAAETEALRIEFQERYHNFRMLLSANQSSLETMAAIEKALQGTAAFGMAFVRSACTGVSVSVYRMIQALDGLAPGRYGELKPRFSAIRTAIDLTFERPRSPDPQPMILPLDRVTQESAHLVGGKTAGLGELRNRLQVPVPNGFAITVAAYEALVAHNDLQAEINRRIQRVDRSRMDHLHRLSSELQQLVIQSEIPPELRAAIRKAYAELEGRGGGETPIALRSSAVGEDSGGASFAGLYRSELNVHSEHLLDAYREVVASKYSLQAITYRLSRGYRDEDVPMGVCCLEMVPAEAGGVVYTRNPISADDNHIQINAVLGLPRTVVEGSGGSDLFVVSRGSKRRIVRREIQAKPTRFVCLPEAGVCRIEESRQAAANAAIEPHQVLALAEIAERIEEHYGCPQDVEWAVTGRGELFILQCRPLEPASEDGLTAALPPGIDSDWIIAAGGVTASPGVAAGPVYRVQREFEILSFPAGGVLVVEQALPRWASLISRAAAVVSEQGGFASHLASVAREFRVPAIFSLDGATDVLEPGREVTVDATGRRILSGRVAPMVSSVSGSRNLMAGSPVYELLRRAAGHIVPLNLLDPDAAGFQADNCRTLHDVTRFIHEKSVLEMFSFGKDHNFSERSSKQLYFHRPMQWWVLNLDDGVRGDIQGRYVHLEEIVSIPMLAFWKGFTAVAWEGPPAIDGRGLAAVMFHSTANRALTAGTRSPYAQRNYFMIARHFCNLQSRLGYHFSSMEALVCEREIENYIGFEFKGGAADLNRRLRRVQFVREILEDCGFRVETRQDTLRARVERHPSGYMLERLLILGYLTLHTRQLDMIMSNPAAVRHYRRKIDRDLEAMLAETS